MLIVKRLVIFSIILLPAVINGAFASPVQVSKNSSWSEILNNPKFRVDMKKISLKMAKSAKKESISYFDICFKAGSNEFRSKSMVELKASSKDRQKGIQKKYVYFNRDEKAYPLEKMVSVYHVENGEVGRLAFKKRFSVENCMM